MLLSAFSQKSRNLIFFFLCVKTVLFLLYLITVQHSKKLCIFRLRSERVSERFLLQFHLHLLKKLEKEREYEKKETLS